MLALFVGSGAAGLIYQVVWSRELVLVFGNTTQAISTIVTAFMLGLGLGGFVAGRVAGSTANPLRFYGVLELFIALYALALPFSVNLIAEVYRGAYSSIGATELGFIRFALALVAVTPATFLMGMTLPVLTRFVVRNLEDAGQRLAELYAANTIGAALGTLVSGYVLIELLGLVLTSYVAVLLNALAGVGALLLSRRAVAAASKDDSLDSPGAEPASSGVEAPGGRKVIFAATFVSGFVALALEMLWTRMLAEGTGSRIYIFVMILAIYLIGIALGSQLYRRYSSPLRDNLTVLGLCFASIGLASVLTVILGSGVLGRLPTNFSYLIMLPATVVMGYAFPLSGKLVTTSVSGAARSIGLLYAWNTAGSILGSFAAAFILVGTLGTNNSIFVLAAASLLLGAVLVGLDTAHRARKLPVTAWVLGVAALLSLAAPLTHLPFTRTVTQNIISARQLPAIHLEDSVSTVDAVGGPAADRRLLLGGIGMTILTIDTRLMAYIPKALRPQAEDFLVIAFGMGATYRSGLILGMQTDVVELSPSVPGLMPVYFQDAAQYLNHPRGKVIIGDGRNYTRLTRKQYDLIAVDPAPPIQSAGNVVLYTREFLEQGKARLKPGGVFMLWIPYDATVADFKDHVRTFRASFSNVLLMFGPGGYGVYMLGSDAPLTFGRDGIAQAFGVDGAAADLAGAADSSLVEGIPWLQLIEEHIWLRDDQVDAFAGPGPLITDDRPRTEYYLLRELLAADRRIVNEELLRRETDTLSRR
ncbi:MAG TPA: fused MFS/spermidine synthase [Chloroflexia bacterium]|nr:fused MFS/spermidine synthase [Chloroflexia bacterium]